MASVLKRALVILAAGAEGMEVITTVDILRRGNVDVTVAGLAGPDVVECVRKLTIKPEISLEDALKQDPYDAIVIPGGAKGVESLAASVSVAFELVGYYNGGKLVAAIGDGPVVLQAHDIGFGQRITCHFSVKGKFSDYKYIDERVVQDGNLVTSQGPETAIQFGLKLVENLVGEMAVYSLWKELVVSSNQMDRALLWKLLVLQYTILSVTSSSYNPESIPLIGVLTQLGLMYLDARQKLSMISGASVVSVIDIEVAEFSNQMTLSLKTLRRKKDERAYGALQDLGNAVLSGQTIRLRSIADVFQGLIKHIKTTKWLLPQLADALLYKFSSAQCKRVKKEFKECFDFTPREISMILMPDFELPEAVGVAGADDQGLDPPAIVDVDD